ncbi:uncharacterized protein FIBRA_03682 [Fibroporia radiculosa]|uniref:TMEM205-like domain-containing protein n=1 Tax=Fibroporia radiculosa TaxID=599839 RepID=J4I9R5_9APHY|nr:uncharacterized protein FIBRA_03682 [Fibroporia radiculosa]CCM01621.1 predicted protein [Fibroporia radiculosa]
MSRVQTLTLASFLSLFNFKSLYLIGYAWLLGMSIWVSFFAGPIAFRALPRHQFGALQHRIFPVYFVMSIIMSSGLLALWTRSHPAVLAHLSQPLVADVAQAYSLASVLLFQGANYFVVGPLTSKTMFQRQKLEKEEGKAYNEAGVSTAMKALNSRFGMLHGASSLANLFSVVVLLFHGLWIGNFGTGI